jgi:XRE family transcriptional regulator, regulator of sulfur utilization
MKVGRMKLKDRLKELRRARDWTLRELAEQTGLSVSYLSDIERGRTNPSISTLEALTGALQVTVIDFLTGVDFAGEQSDINLPPGLIELTKDDEYCDVITEDWKTLLTKIELRGARPEKKQDWLELYLHLKRILEK